MRKKGKESTVLNNETNTEVKTLKPQELELSDRACEVAEKLKQATDSPDKGKIAAIDPESGEYHIGKSIIEAVEEGRKAKNDPKAVFYSVKIGFTSLYRVKGLSLRGYFEDDTPLVNGIIDCRNIRILTSDFYKQGYLKLIADTGFEGAIALDSLNLVNIDKIDTIQAFKSNVYINDFKIEKVEIIETATAAIGIKLMRRIGKRAIFDFESDKVVFED